MPPSVEAAFAADVTAAVPPASDLDACQGPSLQSLPPELLQAIWRAVSSDEGDTLRDQHSLRCTCKAMRAASAPLIHACRMDVDLTKLDLSKDIMYHALCSIVQEQLARFPSDATLTHLVWECRTPLAAELLLPLALPSTFLLRSAQEALVPAIRPKLMSLLHLTLSGDMVIDWSDARTVASCPMLHTLTLTSVPVTGPALEPLALVHGLRTLKLHRLHLPLGSEDLTESLGGLSQLVKLEVTDCWPSEEDEAWDEGEADWSKLLMGDVVPAVAGLTGLQSLTLRLHEGGGHGGGLYVHLGLLTNLTYLCFGSPTYDGQWCGPYGTFPLADELDCYARLVRLQALALPDTMLKDDSIQAIAAMTHLTRLEVLSMRAQADLSTLPCSWREVTVWDPTHTCEEFVRLPWGGLDCLQVGDQTCLYWEFGADDDLQAQAGFVRRACEVLARCWVDNGAGEQSFKLQWRGPAAPAPIAASRLPLLAALAPLQRRCYRNHFIMFFGNTWNPGEDDARVLDQALPGLNVVCLSGDLPRFCSFVAGVATRFTALQWLTVGSRREVRGIVPPLPIAHRDALLSMAMVRSRAGLPLAINCFYGMTNKHRRSCNARLAIEASRGRFKAGVVQFTISPREE